MDSSLKKRLITAICGVPLLIIVLLSPLWVVTAAVIAVSLIGLYEYFRAVRLTSHPYMCILGYVGSVIIALGANFSASASLLVMYLYVIILFLFMIFNKESVSLIHIALLAFGLIYIPYFLSNIIYIRMTEHGKVFIWLVFIGAYMSDTAAYFSGRFLGRNKLCPTVSPNKTIEGAIGGVVGDGIAFVIFALAMNAFCGEFSDESINVWLMFPLGAVTSIISQIGDLVASSIKRQFNIKDFGKILPGHGGILDRFDSIITVAPFIYLMLSCMSIMK